MSKKQPSKQHGNHHQHEREMAEKRALHKDWRAWTVVLLMLAGIIGYVATLDEAESPVRQPGPGVKQGMPADAPVDAAP